MDFKHITESIIDISILNCRKFKNLVIKNIIVAIINFILFVLIFKCRVQIQKFKIYVSIQMKLTRIHPR